MGSDYRLAKPPLIDTIVPTNENFYTRRVYGLPAHTYLTTDTYLGVQPVTWTEVATRYSSTVTELRALNPSLSTLNPTDDITDGIFTQPGAFGTTDVFTNLSNPLRHYRTDPGTFPPTINLNHRYAPDAGGISALALTPAGHGKGPHNGMWATVFTSDQSAGGFPAIRLAFHPQSRSIRDYVTQWEVQLDPIETIPPDAWAWSADLVADLASQRLGDYVYVFSSHRKTVVTTYDSSGTLPIRLDSAGSLTVRRIGPDGVPVTRISESFDTTDETDDWRVMIPHLGFHNGSQHQFFVSDDATPFIWTTFGDVSDNGADCGYFGFADDGSGTFGSMFQNQVTGDRKVTGQLAAYYQTTSLPDGIYAFGPVLVHPWRCGNYGAPELWYFVMHGFGPKTRFDIYAAKWGRHQYQPVPNLIFDDDPFFESGQRRFPSLNPEGYAFDHDWYRPANKISSIGPFTTDIWNQREEPAQSGLVRYAGFRVLRDCNRVGQMHFVVTNNGPRLT